MISQVRRSVIYTSKDQCSPPPPLFTFRADPGGHGLRGKALLFFLFVRGAPPNFKKRGGDVAF